MRNLDAAQPGIMEGTEQKGLIGRPECDSCSRKARRRALTGRTLMCSEPSVAATVPVETPARAAMPRMVEGWRNLP